MNKKDSISVSLYYDEEDKYCLNMYVNIKTTLVKSDTKMKYLVL